MLPSNITAFIDICAAIGQQAQCCALPVVSSSSGRMIGLMLIWAKIPYCSWAKRSFVRAPLE